MRERQRLLTEAWALRCKPLPEEPVWKWAERTCELTQYTENTGPYSTNLTPFVREWLECYRDPSVQEVTKVTGSQVAKTQTDLVGVGWTVCHRPVEILWVSDTGENAKSLSETRWNDLVRHNAELAAVMPANPDDYKKMQQAFARCTMFWAGSNSPGKLASKPIGLIVLDETEKYPSSPQQEAHSAELAEQRVKSYSSFKKIRASTPKLAGGYIWQKYLQGDQRRYYVPCPHCGAMITLEWKQVRWDQDARSKEGWDFTRVAASAHYLCQECEGEIRDHHKTTMLRAGEWRPTNTHATPGHRSYHLSSLYSPWRLTAFGALAVQFLEAKESLLGLQGFINGVLAEPWEEQQYVDPIAFPEGEYTMGEHAEGEKIVLLTADVQSDHFWCVARGHGDGMSSRLHFAGRVESFDDVEALHRRFGSLPNTVGIDCGYERDGEVYKVCARNQWFALRGDAPREGFYLHVLPNGQKIRRIYSRQERIDAHIGTAQSGFCLRIFFAKGIVDDILQQLLLRVRGDWQTPRDAPKEWLEQVNARRKLPRRNPLTGDIRYEWVEVVRKWDHLRDAECMQIVMSAMRGMLREIEPEAGPVKPAGEDPPAVETAVRAAERLVARPPAPQSRRHGFVPRAPGRGFVTRW